MVILISNMKGCTTRIGTREKETCRNDEGIDSARGDSNPKCMCTKWQSFKTHEAKLINGDLHSLCQQLAENQ